MKAESHNFIFCIVIIQCEGGGALLRSVFEFQKFYYHKIISKHFLNKASYSVKIKVC